MVKKEEDILNVSHSLISKIYIIQQEAHGSHRSPEKPNEIKSIIHLSEVMIIFILKNIRSKI